jgi:hypothetical protein
MQGLEFNSSTTEKERERERDRETKTIKTKFRKKNLSLELGKIELTQGKVLICLQCKILTELATSAERISNYFAHYR